MSGYTKKFKENTTMSFRVNKKQLLKYYSKIWETIEKLMNIDILKTNLFMVMMINT